MKVSVAIPVYNKAAHVRQAVESILHGTWKDLEVVAVDDRSTDNSLEVLRSIDDPRLRIIALPENRGPAGAMNAAIEACRGTYIARSDADDVTVPERLAWQVAYMDAHPHIGASSGHLELMGQEKGSWRFPLTPDACRARILFSTPITQGACIFRRSVLEQHGIRYDADWPRVGEDWLMWCRLLQVTELGNIDKVLLYYRRDEGNITKTSDTRMHEALMRRVFGAFGLTLSEEELRLHLLAQRKFHVPPTVKDIPLVRRWLDHLVRLNTERRTFPEAAFLAQVERTWNGLFHPLLDRGRALAFAHLRQRSTARKEHAVYWMKHELAGLQHRTRP